MSSCSHVSLGVVLFVCFSCCYVKQISFAYVRTAVGCLLNKVYSWLPNADGCCERVCAFHVCACVRQRIEKKDPKIAGQSERQFVGCRIRGRPSLLQSMQRKRTICLR